MRGAPLGAVMAMPSACAVRGGVPVPAPQCEDAMSAWTAYWLELGLCSAAPATGRLWRS